MKKAGDLIHAILGKQEAVEAGNWSSFFRGWQAVAGDDLAAHSNVRDVKQSTVIVEVDHPGWLQMFQLQKTAMLRKIKKQFPELDILDIRCFLMKEQPTPEPVNPTEALESPTPAAEDQEAEGYQEFKALLNKLRERGEEAEE